MLSNYFTQLLYPLMTGQLGPRHLGVSGFYNVTVTVTKIASIFWFEL